MLSFITLAVAIPAVLAQNYYGCYTEGAGARAINDASKTDPAMTLSMCQTFCAGYSLYGVEYSTECYCGNALSAGSVPFFAADCSMACAGDSSQTCGGSDRLTLYGTSTIPPTVTANTLPGNVAVSSFRSLDCWTETLSGRALSGRSTTSSAMTIEGCGNFCRLSGFLLFGLEWYGECYCGNTNGSPSAAPLTDCSTPCFGNSSQICGGPSRLSVYEWF